MRKKSAVLVVVLAGVLVLLLYARRPPVEFDSGYRVVMGTFSRIVVIAKDQQTAKACVDKALAEQRRVDSLMSTYKMDSEISEVNRRAYARPVPVSAATLEVLRRAAYFSEVSDGVFDVTVGPLVDLWRAAEKTNVSPTDEALAAARQKVGYEKLLLDEKAMTVRFAVDGMRLDLGGIAKGYAIDKSIEALQQQGAVGGMVDIGGDIRCFGRPPQGQAHWQIGLQDPNVAPDDLGSKAPLLVLKLSDAAVTTSGGYRRFTLVAGQRQSHIMDVHTGRGADKAASVTIIAKDATTADALATAVSVLGADKGLDLIERIPATEAILIQDGQHPAPVLTTGARAYVK